MLDNEELLNKAVAEIDSLDEYVSVVANTKFRPIDGVDFKGLYTGGIVDGETGRKIYTEKPLDSSVLYELLKDGKIAKIGIRRADPTLGKTNQLQFACKHRRAGWDRYTGFYYSKDDEPILFEGYKWNNPEPKGNGWAMEGRNYYYTEKITDYWYYYEMIFNNK